MTNRLLIFFLLVVPAVQAQHSLKDRRPDNRTYVTPLKDSAWHTLTVRQKVDYCLLYGERYIQLCGRWGGGGREDVKSYIFSNTRHLYFLGDFTYSKRQVDLFNQYPDSLAWYLREDLFERGEDLFYWHNIIRAMQPDYNIGKILVEYYQFKKGTTTEPLTLLINWMERDELQSWLQSELYKVMEESRELKIVHTQGNAQALLKIADKYMRAMPFPVERNWRTFSRFLLDSLGKADTLMPLAGILSHEMFNRLNAKELLVYCDSRREKYRQLCGLPAGFNIAENIYLTPGPLLGDAADYSKRQLDALKANRDSVAFYILQAYSQPSLNNNYPRLELVLQLHVWQVVPYLLKLDRLHLFNRLWNLPVLCQFMFINRYPPFIEFWESKSNGSGAIPRTTANEQRIVELAADYYNWKLNEKE